MIVMLWDVSWNFYLFGFECSILMILVNSGSSKRINEIVWSGLGRVRWLSDVSRQTVFFEYSRTFRYIKELLGRVNDDENNNKKVQLEIENFYEVLELI